MVPTTYTTECLTCGKGKVAPGPASGCVDCVVGKYQPNNAATSRTCSTCDAGKVVKDKENSDNNGCVSCVAGKYQPVDVAVAYVCTDCDAGQYAKAGNRVKCFDCPLGQYHVSKPTGDTTDCDKCAAGQVAPSATGACADCTLGKYQPQAEADSYECLSCSKGQFAKTDDKSQCFDCDGGKYNDVVPTTYTTGCKTRGN